jgi:hypothetical protein
MARKTNLIRIQQQSDVFSMVERDARSHMELFQTDAIFPATMNL